MSLETWKQEFYPPIREWTNSWKRAAEHSLRKWRGLRPTTLKRHGLTTDHVFDVRRLLDGEDELIIDSRSCALCVRATRLARQRVTRPFTCSVCPLSDCVEEFDCFCGSKANPEPMINALRDLVDRLS